LSFICARTYVLCGDNLNEPQHPCLVNLPTIVWRSRCSVFRYIANGLELINTEESLLAIRDRRCSLCSDRQYPCMMLHTMKVSDGVSNMVLSPTF